MPFGVLGDLGRNVLIGCFADIGAELSRIFADRKVGGRFCARFRKTAIVARMVLERFGPAGASVEAAAGNGGGGKDTSPCPNAPAGNLEPVAEGRYSFCRRIAHPAFLPCVCLGGTSAALFGYSSVLGSYRGQIGVPSGGTVPVRSGCATVSARSSRSF